MTLLAGFNANEVQDTNFGGVFTPVAEGVYTVMINSAEEKRNSKNTGSFLMLEVVILDDSARNRRIWRALNLDNPSATSVASARAELAQICKALGLVSPTKEDLCNRPMLADVRTKMEKKTDSFTGETRHEPTNVIVRYAATGSAPTGVGLKLDGGAANTAAPLVQSSAAPTPPWKK